MESTLTSGPRKQKLVVMGEHVIINQKSKYTKRFAVMASLRKRQ